MWNKLPLNIRSAESVPQFKKVLKNHLHRLAFVYNFYYVYSFFLMLFFYILFYLSVFIVFSGYDVLLISLFYFSIIRNLCTFIVWYCFFLKHLVTLVLKGAIEIKFIVIITIINIARISVRWPKIWLQINAYVALFLLDVCNFLLIHSP